MIDPINLLVKTAANYVAFKSVKSTVDYCTGRPESKHQFLKASECVICMNVWSNSPAICPHCQSTVFKKLYRDYDHRRYEEENLFNVDSNLMVGKNNDIFRR